MDQRSFFLFNTVTERVESALSALRSGNGVIVLDDENRENEGDIVFSAEKITVEQVALAIRYGSGIVCLCITEKHRKQLSLPMMVKKNTSKFNTSFTVSIEASSGVTTGVSALDRFTTIRTAISDSAKPSDLNRPGHVFPICAKEGGVLVRPGHTEATIDLVRLAGLRNLSGVLCELTNDNGTMARTEQCIVFSKKHSMPIVTIVDLIEYRKLKKS